MPDDTSPGSENRVTSDPDTVREWAEEYDVIPVGVPGEEPRVRFIPRRLAEQEMADRERMEWDEVGEEFDRSDLALVDRGEGDQGWAYDLLERGEVAERAALESEEVEGSLLEGETVTTTIDETRVIETAITETETVEHEIVDRETLESRVIDRELVDRAVEAVDVMDDGRVELEVYDTVSITREEPERLVVESRLIDAEIVESDTVTDDEVSATVDVEGVQRNVLESDLIGSDVDTTRVIEGDVVESETEGGVVTTELLERRVIEEEVIEHRRLVLDVVEDELLSTETATSEVIERAIVEHGDLATGAIEEGAATGGTGSTDVDEPATSAGADESETVGAEMTSGETDAVDAADEASDVRTVPTEADRGKTVVDREGQEVGMVADIEGDTLYVDPHPSITDRIKATLDWGEMDEESLPVPPEYVERIEHQVVLSVDRDEEFQDESH